MFLIVPSKQKILLLLLLIGVIGLCAYVGWYSFDRHEKIVQAQKCSDQLTNPPKPTMVTGPDGNPAPLYSLNGCVSVVIPPSLWDMLRDRIVFENVPQHMKVNSYTFTDTLLGRYTFGPADIGCDQSATTTDCASILKQNPPPQPQESTATTTTETIGHFSFAYPKGQGKLSAFGWENSIFPGDYTLTLHGITNYELFIFTAFAPLSSLNPAATSLDDYRRDYSPADTKEVHILSTEDVTINGIPMLRQRYSVGYWATGQNGQQIFKSDSEADVTNELRYVFFDDIDTKFVILTGWQADEWIDYIAHTIKLLR